MLETSQRLHKMLAAQGYGSRRTIERWIQEGKVQINGKIATVGVKVNAQDTIALPNHTPFSVQQILNAEESTKVIIYYKPSGEICSAQDPFKRPTVFSKLPKLSSGRWVMVGRLDYNTLGLLLFTNQGELSHRLLHPRYGVEREYAVRLHGFVTLTMLSRLKKGIVLEGKVARFTEITRKEKKDSTNQWYLVTLTEGRQREVRKLWASQGVTVTRLIRIRFGPVVLPAYLKPGQWEWLSKPLVHSLLK